jgi:hypothetical protein
VEEVAGPHAHGGAVRLGVRAEDQAAPPRLAGLSRARRQEAHRRSNRCAVPTARGQLAEVP